MADLLLVEEFSDAVHEGDGEQMLTIWKLLLLYFRTTGHTNYAAENVRLITEASALLTERGAHGAVSLIPRENQVEHFLSPCNGTMESCIQAALGYW